MTIRGLLDVTDEERAEWRRQREQERKAAEAAAQREAKLQVELDQIDDAYSHALRNEIKAESEALKISSTLRNFRSGRALGTFLDYRRLPRLLPHT